MERSAAAGASDSGTAGRADTTAVAVRCWCLITHPPISKKPARFRRYEVIADCRDARGFAQEVIESWSLLGKFSTVELGGRFQSNFQVDRRSGLNEHSFSHAACRVRTARGARRLRQTRSDP